MIYYSRNAIPENDPLLQIAAVKAAYERAKTLLSESVFSDVLALSAVLVHDHEDSIQFTVGMYNTHKAFNRFKAYETRYYELRERLYWLRIVVVYV